MVLLCNVKQTWLFRSICWDFYSRGHCLYRWSLIFSTASKDASESSTQQHRQHQFWMLQFHFSLFQHIKCGVYMEFEVVLCQQGHWCRSSARAGLRGPPQLPAHGPEEPLRLLPAPRGLLLSGTAGRAVHPAAAREQEEAAAPDAGRWGAVQTPPTGQEEEGQCAAAGHSQPGDLRDSWKSGLCSNHSLCIQNIYICHVHAGED